MSSDRWCLLPRMAAGSASSNPTERHGNQPDGAEQVGGSGFVCHAAARTAFPARLSKLVSSLTSMLLWPVRSKDFTDHDPSGMVCRVSCTEISYGQCGQRTWIRSVDMAMLGARFSPTSSS